MAREEFKRVNFRPDSLALIKKCNAIVESYSVRLSLRQLYYRLVATDVITNTKQSYKGLSALLTDARMAGLMDWNALEDRHRMLNIPSEWSSIASLVRSALNSFRFPRWEGQDYYAELWCEKDALSSILEPIADEYHAPLQINRGFSSVTFMYEAAKRFQRDADGRTPIIFYIGDHDPSGLDMVRDIRDRMETFGSADVDVQHIALTSEQVRQYRPPPNPTKMADSRARAYIREHGRTCWEVDALPPDVLEAIVRASFDSIVDRETMDAVIAREDVAKDKLREAAERIKV